MICNKCHISEFRKHRVIGRGEQPSDILFIGEAPGKSENLRGKAFIGPSGRLLNDALEAARIRSRLDKLPTFYITNIIQCRPCDFKGGPNRQPTLEEVKTCRPNLEDVYLKTKPFVVVLIGKVAAGYCSKQFEGAYKIPHPAYILRRGGRASPEYRSFVAELSKIIKEI